MSRLIGFLVVENEEHRYLEACLKWNRPWMDGLFVYDGGSTDNTFQICSRFADNIVTRPDSVPTFLEHEGEYRKAAFAAMVQTMEITEEDWIFSLDADEFLSGSGRLHLRDDLNALIWYAISTKRDAVDIHIPEVWDVRGPEVFVRMDGFWNQMSLPRLFRYRSDWQDKRLTFRNKKMGCGSGPAYTYLDPVRTIKTCSLMHFGYAYDGDKVAKSERYLSLPNHGHNDKHIRSILKAPDLAKWDGMVPKWYRGVR